MRNYRRPSLDATRSLTRLLRRAGEARSGIGLVEGFGSDYFAVAGEDFSIGKNVLHMSIRDRVEDVEFLCNHGRKEGAFLSVLVAVAATSRLRYPDRKTVNDGEAFRQFFESTSRIRLSVEFRGNLHTIEQVFYKWLRCELVHEGGLPVDIKFMDDKDPGMLTVRVGGRPEYVLKISNGWFNHLIKSVASTPENRELFRYPKSLP